MKTIREEIVPNNDNELVGYYTVEMLNCLRKMHGYKFAQAIFGTFERSGNTVTYTATVWAEDGTIYHPYHSEFLDDLNRFKAETCTYFN